MVKQENNAYHGLNDYIRSMRDMGNPFSGDLALIQRVSEDTRMVFDAYHSKVISGYDEDLRDAAMADSMLAKEGLPPTEVKAVKSGYVQAVRRAENLLVQALGQRGYRFGQPDSKERNTVLRAAELPYMNSRKVDLLLDSYGRRYGDDSRPAWISYSVYGKGQEGPDNVQHLVKNLTENYRSEIATIIGQPGLRSLDSIYGAYYDVTVNRFDPEVFLMEADNADEAVLAFNEAQKYGRISPGEETGRGRFQTGPLGYCTVLPGAEQYIPMPKTQLQVETRPGVYPVQVNSLFATHAVVAANDEQEALSLAKRMVGLRNPDEETEYAHRISMEEETLVSRRVFPAVRVVNEQAMDGAVLMGETEDIPSRDRVTDVSLMKMSVGRIAIRCKIDGEQQGAKVIKMADRLALGAGIISKEELAVKYFQDALDRNPAQELNRGMHR